MIQVKIDEDGNRMLKSGKSVYIALVAIDFDRPKDAKITRAFTFDDDVHPAADTRLCGYVIASMARHFINKYNLSPEQLLDFANEKLMSGKVIAAPKDEGK